MTKNNYFKIIIVLQIIILILLIFKQRPVFETRDKHTIDHVIERYIEKSDSLVEKAKIGVKKVESIDKKIKDVEVALDTAKVKKDTSAIVEEQGNMIDLFKIRVIETDSIVKDLFQANDFKDSSIVLLKSENFDLKKQNKKLSKKNKRKGFWLKMTSGISAGLLIFSLVK